MQASKKRIRNRGLLRAATFVAAFCAPVLSHALNYTVDSTADSVDADVSDGICADAAGNCSLRAAVQQANAWPGSDDIVLPAGTFNLSLTGSDDLAASGDLDILEDLTITGAGATATIIDGGAQHRLFQIFGGSTVTLADMTLQNGRSDDSGGAIASEGRLTLRDMVLRNNSTLLPTLGGGAIYSSGLNGSLALERVTVENNSTAASGGAIDIINGSLSIMDSRLSGNSAAFNGGALSINGGTSAAISNSTLSGNSATGSGGINGLGGAIFNFTTLTIDNSTLSGNSALFGGAIYDEGSKSASSPISGTLTINHSTISGNTASATATNSGGGVFISNLAVFNHTTVTRNSAALSGGGIAMDTAGTSQNQGFLDLQASIVANQASGGDCSGGANITSKGFNLDSDNSCNLGDATDLHNASELGSADILHASRALFWLQPDVLVLYDRAISATPGRFKRFWLNLPAPPQVDGRQSLATTASGQQLFITTLLPAGADIAAEPMEPFPDETAEDEPMQYRLRVEAPGGPAEAYFLHVLQGADPGAQALPVALVESDGGTPFQGAVVGGETAVLFPVQVDAPFTELVYRVPAGVHTHYVTGLPPESGYTVTFQVVEGNLEVRLTPGGPQQSDSGGVLTIETGGAAQRIFLPLAATRSGNAALQP